MGGRGGAGGGALIGTPGTGIKVNLSGGKQLTYFVDASGNYRELSSASILRLTNKSIKQIIEKGNAQFIPQKQMKTIMKDRNVKIMNSPDYELGYGVPWGNAEYRKTARTNRLASRIQGRKR